MRIAGSAKGEQTLSEFSALFQYILIVPLLRSWAFVDFHLTSHATLALLDHRNHMLNGRNLIVEYASADAVRRGGGRMDNAADGAKRANGGGRNDRNDRNDRFAGGNKRSRPDYDEGEIPEEGGRPTRAPRLYNPDEEQVANEVYNNRPPLSLNPFDEVKVHKPNQAERAALRAEKEKNKNARGGSGAKRQKPGAALASAQRAKVAILPGAGTKVVFGDD